MIVYVFKWKGAQTWRQRIGAVVIRNPQRSLKLNDQICLWMDLRKRELQFVVFEFNHVLAFV